MLYDKSSCYLSKLFVSTNTKTKSNVMRKTKFIPYVIPLLFLTSCGGGDSPSSEQSVGDGVITQIDELKKIIKTSTNYEEIDSVQTELRSFLSDSDLVQNPSIKKAAKKALSMVDKRLDLSWKTEIDFSEKFSQVKDYAYVSFPALKGDTIRLTFSSDVRVKYEILEERSKRQLQRGGYASDYSKKIYIPHSDVFTLYLKNNDAFYYSVKVERKSSSVESHLKQLSYTEDSVVLEKAVPHSEKGVRLSQTSVFYEPEVRVLDNSMLIYDKTYLPIEVPEKTVEILYRLEVTDADNTARSTEDNLYNEVSKNTKKIKVAGLELWSSETSGTSLTREILNSLTMPEQRDETVDMYFIDTQENLTKFLNGAEGGFAPDLNYSSVGTPSKNGLIKNKNNGFYYLAIKGTSMKDVKIWIDVLALYEETFDYIIKRKIVIE